LGSARVPRAIDGVSPSISYTPFYLRFGECKNGETT
jgi:hypothetical protein